MGNISSELYPMNETNEKVQKTMNTLKQGKMLLENRSTIAYTETNRLEGFTGTGSLSTVKNKLNDYENELEEEHQTLNTLVSEYTTLVNDDSASTEDIETKKNELEAQQQKIETLTTKINNYYQNTVNPDINQAKKSMNEYNTYITSNRAVLESDTDSAKIPAIYYALNENVHILERMRYYWYVVYLLIFLGVILALYMMGVGFGTIVNQLKKVPQIINNGFKRVL